MRKLLTMWKLYRLNKRRFETNRQKTGNIKSTCNDYLLFTSICIYEEWEIETCLPSHDITDEYHTKWICMRRDIYWFWE